MVAGRFADRRLIRHLKRALRGATDVDVHGFAAPSFMDVDTPRHVHPYMIFQRSSTGLFLILPILLGLPATGQDAPSLDFPRDPDHLVIYARESWIVNSTGVKTPGWHTLRVFGDGRVRLDPSPPWLEGERIILRPEAVEQLLHSLDDALDLATHLSLQPAPDTGSFVAVHLERYASADRKVIVDHLDALVTRDLDTAFEELTVLTEWLVRRPPKTPVWFTSNPWPRICRPEYRHQQGLRVLEPVWCSKPVFYKPGWSTEDEARDAVRVRLRKRLRSLPRGLQRER